MPSLDGVQKSLDTSILDMGIYQVQATFANPTWDWPHIVNKHIIFLFFRCHHTYSARAKVPAHPQRTLIFCHFLSRPDLPVWTIYKAKVAYTPQDGAYEGHKIAEGFTLRALYRHPLRTINPEIEALCKGIRRFFIAYFERWACMSYACLRRTVCRRAWPLSPWHCMYACIKRGTKRQIVYRGLSISNITLLCWTWNQKYIV